MSRTSTKATGRTSLDALQTCVPQEILEGLKAHRYYAHGSNEIVISSDKTRRQQENREQCVRKRDTCLREIANDIISKEKATGPPM